MPAADVAQLESIEAGFLQTSLDDNWDWICDRLRKRYNIAQIQTAPNRTVLRWLTKLVTRDAYDKRGNNPSAASDAEAIYKAAERVEAEVEEAADSRDGLFELPLLPGQSPSGVSRGGPLSYSETSPYVSTTIQAVNGRVEDADGQGT